MTNIDKADWLYSEDPNPLNYPTFYFKTIRIVDKATTSGRLSVRCKNECVFHALLIYWTSNAWGYTYENDY